MCIAIVQMQAVRLDMRYRMPASHGAACFCKALIEQSRRSRWVFRHEPCRARENRDARLLASGVEPLPGQSKRKFTAGCATADHGKPFRMSHGCQCRETVAEIADRLDRDAMRGGARDGFYVRLTANIDRQYIKRNRRPAVHVQPVCLRVEPGHRCMDKPCPRHAGKFCKVDMNVGFRPRAFDKSRKHAGIGGVDITGDKRGPQALDRLHRKRFEERNLRMSSANEDEFTLDRPGLFHQEEKALSCPLK